MSTHYPSACNEPDCSLCADILPTPQLWPGEEGYCRSCHMIVSAQIDVVSNEVVLCEHRGGHAQAFGNGMCVGSGHEPWPMPDNYLDPWGDDGRGSTDATGEVDGS